MELFDEREGFERVENKSAVDGWEDWYFVHPGVAQAIDGAGGAGGWAGARAGGSGGVDAVVTLHGHGSHGDQLFVRADLIPRLRAMRERGLGILLPNLRDNAWMNPAAVADLARLVVEERARHGWRRVFLVAGSMGGTGSLIFAMRHPELVDGVAALGAASAVGDYRAWCEARTAEGGRPILHEIATAIAAHYRPEDYAAHDVRAHAQHLTMPVLLYHGEADATIPVEESRALAARLAGKKDFHYHEIPNGDHDSPLSYFTEALDRLLGAGC